MKAILTLLCVLLCSPAAEAQQYTQHLDIRYDTIPNVAPNLLSLDLYVPVNRVGPLPVVVYVHGGSWRAGDKARVSLKPEFFTGRGYMFVSVNYRLSPDPPDTTQPDAVRYPDHPRDVAKAIAWIHDNIHTYGGDKRRIGLTGHSAGGHIAAVVASNARFLEEHGIAADIPCVCMYDAAAYNVVRLIALGNAYSFSIQSAMGNDPAAWEDGSPALQVRRHPGLGTWILFSQEAGSTLYEEAVLMRDSLAGAGYAVPHFPLALEHNEINVYVGVQDSADYRRVLLENRTVQPSPNAYTIARAYTDSVGAFFGRCFGGIATNRLEESDQRIPVTLTLHGNAPNPFASSTTIRYGVARAGFVALTVHDVLGRKIATLVDGWKEPGEYTERYGSDEYKRSPGTYLYVLRSGVSILSRTMVVMR